MFIGLALLILIASSDYLTVDIVSITTSVIQGTVKSYDSQDNFIDLPGIPIQLYLYPSNTLDGADWDFSLMYGEYTFTISAKCAGLNTVAASSQGYNSGYSPAITISDNDCSQLSINPSKTILPTNETLTLTVYSEDSLGDALTCYYDIADSQDGKVMGSKTAENVNTPTDLEISLISPGTKRLIVECNRQPLGIPISAIVEVTITGDDVYYLEIDFDDYEPKIVDELFTVNVYLKKDIQEDYIQGEFEVFLILIGDGTLNGVLNKNSDYGVATFAGLSIDNSGKFKIVAYAENVYTVTSSEITLDRYSVKVSLPSGPPECTYEFFDILVQVYLGTDLATTGGFDLSITSNPSALIKGSTSINSNDEDVLFNIAITEVGTYTITGHLSDMDEDTTISFTIHDNFIKIFYDSDAPTNTDSIFSVKVEIYKDSDFISLYTKEDYNVILELSPEGDLLGSVSETTSGGSWVYDNLKITDEGTFSIVPSGAGLISSNLDSIVIKDYHLKVTIVDIPVNTQSIFSVVVEVYTEADFLTKFVGENFVIEIKLTPSGSLEGETLKPSLSGEVTFDSLQITSQYTYQILAYGDGLYDGLSEEFTIQDLYIGIEFIDDLPPATTFQIFTLFIGLYCDDTYISVCPGVSVVTISLEPESTLTGTTSRELQGILSYENLNIPIEGTYKIVATGDGVFDGKTQEFTIKNYYLKVILNEPIPIYKESIFIVTVIVYLEETFETVAGTFTQELSIKLEPEEILIGQAEDSIANGVAVFEDLRVENPGTYKIVAECYWAKKGESDEFTIENIYLDIAFAAVIPSSTDEVFDIIVKTYENEEKSVLHTSKDYDINIELDLEGTLSGDKSQKSSNGQAFFPNLYILTEGTFTIIATATNTISDISIPVTIIIKNEVNGITIKSNDYYPKVLNKFIVTVNLISYYGTPYTLPTMIYLTSSTLTLIGETQGQNIDGSYDFYLQFDEIGSTLVQAFTDDDYEGVESNVIEIFSVDSLCEDYDDEGECLSCSELAEFDDGECVCIKHSSVSSGNCKCNSGYTYYLSECVPCGNRFAEYELVGSYLPDYKSIYIEFSDSVSNSSSDSCLYSFLKPSSIFDQISQCVWLDSRKFILKSKTMLPAEEVTLSFSPDFLPVYEKCNPFLDFLDVKVPVLDTIPFPQIELAAPSKISLPCHTSGILIKNLAHNPDYTYTWICSPSNPLLDESISNQNTETLSLTQEVLFPGNLTITVIVLSTVYQTESQKTITILITDTYDLTISFNYGQDITIKASESLFIRALIIDSCGLTGDFIFSWSYLSENLLDFDEILGLMQRSDVLYIPKNFLEVGKVYEFGVEVQLGNENVNGESILTVIVVEDELVVWFNRWPATIGKKDDFYIEAFAQDPNNQMAEIEFSWKCSEGTSLCFGDDGEVLFDEENTSELWIEKEKLRDKALYMLEITAWTINKSKIMTIEFVVEEEFNDQVFIETLEFTISNRKSFALLPIVDVKNDGPEFKWAFVPPLLNDDGLFNNKSYFRVYANSMEPGFIYTLEFNIQGSEKKQSRNSIVVGRAKLPECEYFSANTIGDYWQIDVGKCSSEYGRISYQFGVQDANLTVWWLTNTIYISTSKVVPKINSEKAVVKICDQYECNQYFIDIDDIEERQLSITEDLMNITNNFEAIPNSIIYYSSFVNDTASFDILFSAMEEYFYAEDITESVLDLYFSCLSALMSLNPYINSTTISLMSSLTLSILDRYDQQLEILHQEYLKDIITPYLNLFEFPSLLSLIHKIGDLMLKGCLPGDSSLIADDNFTLYTSRAFYENIKLSKIVLPFVTIFLPGDLSENLTQVFDVRIFSFKTIDYYIETQLFISGDYKNYTLTLETPYEYEEKLENPITIMINGEFYSKKHHPCYTLTENYMWTHSGCSVEDVEDWNLTINVDRLAMIKVQETDNKCSVGRGPVIAMGICIIFAILLVALFIYHDKDNGEKVRVLTYWEVYPMSSLFIVQFPHRRALIGLQMCINFMVMLCLIGVFEVLFNSPERVTYEKYGEYQEENIHPGAAGWAMTQALVIPFFCLNSRTDIPLSGRVMQIIFLVMLFILCIIGIIYMTVVFCSEFTFYWIINFLIFFGIQLCLELVYAFLAKVCIIKRRLENNAEYAITHENENNPQQYKHDDRF